YEEYLQIGFGLVMSDFATYAYIGDVFVLESHRGRDIAKWLMEYIMWHRSLQGLRRWSLVTQDAHGLYAQFGFTPLQSPERHMELLDADVYKRGLPENE